MLDRSGALGQLGSDAVFPSLRAAVEAYESAHAVVNSKATTTAIH